MKLCYQEHFNLITRLQNVFKTSSRCLEDVYAIRLEDVLKASSRHLAKTPWRRLEDVRPRRIYWSWPRRLEDVLETSSEDVRLRRTYLSSSRRLEHVFWRRKTPSRRLHQDECLLGSLYLCFCWEMYHQ